MIKKINGKIKEEFWMVRLVKVRVYMNNRKANVGSLISPHMNTRQVIGYLNMENLLTNKNK